MEDISPKKNFIRRAKKKKATVNESSKAKKIPFQQINHKRSNSEHIKKDPNKSIFEGAVINLITKGPSINKLIFKNDNFSLKSGSMPKANKKQVKKFRSLHIDKGKNDISNNIMIKKKHDSIKNSNITLNYYNMDYIEKIHNLRGEAKDFLSNNNTKKSRKPNFVSKNYISNDKLMTFNNCLNKNPIYEFYNPTKEIEKGKEKIKKPIQKIQSVNQEKRVYKFSDFKVIKDTKKEEEDDESVENINPDDYREGNNIQLIDGSSFSEEKDESSSLSSDENGKKEKKKKTDALSNLVNKSIKDNQKKKIERLPSQNYYNSNNNSEIEDNYFKNDTKFFMSPKANSKHPSNKSVKSDAKSDYFNNAIAYFNESNNNNDSIIKNSFLGNPINKNKIRKLESLLTNSNYDYEGDIEEGYDLTELGNKIVNNLNINDSYSNIKSPDISQIYNDNVNNNPNNNKINNNDNANNNANNNAINNNINNNKTNLNNNIPNNYNNIIMKNIPNTNSNIINNKNLNKNLRINNPTTDYINQNNDIRINNINNDFNNQNKITDLPLRNYVGNGNQSNIINIHNMNNYNNNNFIFGNNNSGINLNQINPNSNNLVNNSMSSNSMNNSMSNSLNNSMNNSRNNSMNNNVNIPQNNDLSSYLLNYQANNRINDPNFNINNYIMNKNQIDAFQLKQLIQNNALMNENNNQYINYDMNGNINRLILNNPNYFQSNINNINTNFNNNIFNNINNNLINNINNNLNNNLNNSINNNINNNLNNKLNNRNNNYYNQNNQYNLNIGGDNQNNNIVMNYINYLNSQNSFNNDINNNNMNKILFSANNQYNYNNSQRKKQKNYNNYYNQNIINQNMFNLNNSNLNNQNYINQLQYNNYINQNNNNNFNNNINLSNPLNLYNNINNSIIQNNLNMNPNLNNPSNIPNNDNYNMIHSMGNLSHQILNNNNNNINNNNSNKQNNLLSNRQKKQNLNLLSNEELAKQAYSLARNQNDCRYLQKRIENNQNLVPTLFFPNILGHIQELSNDQFGNYYIKIIIKYLPDDMIYKFIQLIHPSIPKIGTNQYGTKVLQYLIEFLNNEKNLFFFIEKTLPHVVELVNDLNGIHIIQRLICIKNDKIQLIFNKVFENIQLIAVTRDGSNFIKKLIEFFDENNLILLINAINNNLSIIITNQYGNYIIQNIIIKDNLILKYQIIETIIKNIVNFSNQKFSSNVVEKCFEVKEMKDKVIDAIIKNNNFEQILLNEYGNYVIQKALLKSDQNKQIIMLKLLVPLVHKLQCMPFGQKLLTKLFTLHPRLSIFILNSGEQL